MPGSGPAPDIVGEWVRRSLAPPSLPLRAYALSCEGMGGKPFPPVVSRLPGPTLGRRGDGSVYRGTARWGDMNDTGPGGRVREGALPLTQSRGASALFGESMGDKLFPLDVPRLPGSALGQRPLNGASF